MNQSHKFLLFICNVVLVIFLIIWLITTFQLTWVEVNEKYAEVTVNFLIPMDQAHLKEHIKFVCDDQDVGEFDYAINWLSEHAVSIKIKEDGLIKGKHIQLNIEKAPTKWFGIYKSANIDIQFRTTVEILIPKDDFIISSTNSFEVQFNTPMDVNQLYKYFQCNAVFSIKPTTKTLNNGRVCIDPTRFIFKPNQSLKNGNNYVLYFKKGMPSKGGTFLMEDRLFNLKVDEKPIIKKTYPANEDKWIGLYPRLLLESESPMVKATVTIDNRTYIGVLQDSYHASFLLKDCLLPNTTYKASFQIEAVSGELSDIWDATFSTTSLDHNRIWLEVICNDKGLVNCYQGNKKIRTMSCSIGKEQYAPQLGTFYLQEKRDVFEDYVHKEGANYWLRFTEQYGFQGYVRDAYWNILKQPKENIGARTKRKNIILSDDDAKWLYENLPDDAMIIIRN